MKKIILAVSLVAVLPGCAQFKDWYSDARAEAGPTAAQQPSPFPRSSSNIAGN